jgi:hypothetical protein
MSGGGSQPSSQSVTTSQQIPLYEQQFSQQNQALAQSLGSQPFPQYQGALVSGFTPAQQVGQGQAIDAASSYQPLLNAGVQATGAALSSNPVDSGAVSAMSPANAGVISSYMNPYVQSSLAPQIQDLQTQLAQQQNQLGAQATQAGAFGDARQGVQEALNNHYANQALSGLVSQGYNTAYNSALQTAGQQQQIAQQQQQMGMGEQNLMLQGGNQLANMGAANQSLGLTGAGAIYNVGSQQQQQQQQGLNTAYQQYMNAVQWPYQMLNVQESALSNSPYNMTNQVTLPNANQSAQNLGMFASLAGLLGGGSGGGAQAPFGGQAYNPSNTVH